MHGPDTFSLSPDVLSKLGIPIERLCARAGVSRLNAWVTNDFFRIWAAAEEEFHDPRAGIRFGDEGIARGYGVAAIVALHAPDFCHALAALSRYKSLTCPELVEVEVKGGEAVVRYRWLQAMGPVPRMLVDMTMASLRQLARQAAPAWLVSYHARRGQPVSVPTAPRAQRESLPRQGAAPRQPPSAL